MDCLKLYNLKVTTDVSAKIDISEPSPDMTVFDFAWEKKPAGDISIELSFDLPAIDIQYFWQPMCGLNRTPRVDWQGPILTRLPSSAPVLCYFNTSGRNRFTAALSEVYREVATRAGVREEDGMLIYRARIPADATTGNYTLKFYHSFENVSFAETLRSASAWWERECGIRPMRVPDAARQPMYSSWYCFHQALEAGALEAECARAAKLGMRTVIVDDGWQTDNGNRGYAYCGDWDVTPNKFPDMRAHVERVHELGMKYMLWYSVPFIGKNAANWERFKDKILSYIERLGAGVLDPRYPDVREFLIDTYRQALINWDLDGFKLDFIDSFRMGDRAAESDPAMDYTVLEEAVLRLMQDVAAALAKIKPDILVEFRQSYIGPAMRTFGNMFRVGDCPDDLLANRVGMVDLRLLSGSTAVHSDMLMWHKDEPVECAARQLLNVIFAVPQISVRLDVVSGECIKMLGFWLRFIDEHRDLLLDAPLEVDSPQTLYPLVRACDGERSIIALYDTDHVAHVNPAQAKELFLINATSSERVVVCFDAPARYNVALRDCMGNENGVASVEYSGLQYVNIPVSGVAYFTAK